MSKYIFSSLLAALLMGSIAAAHAAEELSAAPLPPEQLHKIEALQRRADKLSFGEPGADNYHLAKARTWLDLALSEYHENDAGGIVASAILQAESLLDALTNKQTVAIGMDTPQVEGSETVRPDLWEKIAGLKSSAQFSCGQRPVAEAEVLLVWAGHEKLESSWEHAEPYASGAEDRLKEATVAIGKCSAQMPVVDKLVLSSDTLFEFASATLAPSALGRLDKLAGDIRNAKSPLDVELVGHTDRLRSDGRQERNQVLSEQRAETIRQYLIHKGIPAERITALGAGSSQPLVQCPANQGKAKQVACLKPNRRVEIILRGARDSHPPAASGGTGQPPAK